MTKVIRAKGSKAWTWIVVFDRIQKRQIRTHFYRTHQGAGFSVALRLPFGYVLNIIHQPERKGAER